MTHSDLDRLLGAATPPPEPPMDRFLATIPQSGGASSGLRRPVLAGMLMAACLAVVAGGAVLSGVVPLQSQAPVADETTVVMAEDEAFAAALSGDLVLEAYASEDVGLP